MAIGERLSALLMAAYLESQGTRAAAVNAAQVIATDDVFGNATPLMEETRERAAAVLRPLLDQRVIPVVTGFNAATLDGRPTTLGRGGSDFSAAILAAAMDAEELWIWTDVDGIMTGDPRLIPDARVLDEITYSEAAELAYAGAKVLHPAHAGAADRAADSGVEQEQFRAGEARDAHRGAARQRRGCGGRPARRDLDDRGGAGGDRAARSVAAR